MRIVVSSSNIHKIEEIQNMLGSDYDLVSKSELGYDEVEVEENGATLEENALLKAKALYELVQDTVIADDTGLFVDTLNGQPGLHTARYAGEHASYDENNTKLLEELSKFKDKEDRTAQFRTIICLITKDGEIHYANGELEGYISSERKGDNDFGYNPIFEVKETGKTLAEHSDEERYSINHRKIAIDKLKEILESLK